MSHMCSICKENFTSKTKLHHHLKNCNEEENKRQEKGKGYEKDKKYETIKEETLKNLILHYEYKLSKERELVEKWKKQCEIFHKEERENKEENDILLFSF